MDKKLEMLIRNSKIFKVETLQNEVAKVMANKGYGTSVWERFEPYGLYRARQHDHLEGSLRNGELYPFISELEFWENKPENCLLGRCNDNNESIFYCTNEFEVAVQEIKPNKEYITVAGFLPKPKEFRNSHATAVPIGIQYLSKLPSLRKFFNDKPNVNPEFKETDDFLNTLFHLDILEDKSNLYKLSVAVTRNLMVPVMTKRGQLPMNGLVYSSMARDKKGYNIAFKPEHVLSNFYLSGVQTHKVLENNDEKIVLQLVRNGHPKGIRSLDKSFEINWFDPLDNGEVYSFDKSPTEKIFP